MNIDIRTLAFIMGLTGILQVIAIYLQYLLSKTYQGIGWWLLWSSSTAAGLLSLLLRDIVPVGLISASIFLSNILLLAGQIFLYIGITRFLDKKENRGIIIAVFTVFILSTFYVLYINKDDNARTLILYAAAAIFAFLAAQGLFVNKTRSFTVSANFISAVLFAYGCYFALRALAAVTVSHVDSVFTPTLIQIATFLVMLTTGFLCTLGLIIMVSQRSNAEMKEAKEQFELIFNTGPDATLITRPKDGLIVNINEGFTALTGYTRAETVGKSSLAINLWKDPVDRQNVVNELGKKGFCDNYEAFFQLKDGGQIDGTMSAKIITLQGVQHIISVTRDITERKRVEDALKASEEKFKAMVETIPMAIYLSVGVEQISEYISPTMVKLFGYTMEDIPTVAQWWPLAYPDETYRKQISEEWTIRIKRAIETQSSIEPMETVVTCKDGSKKNILWGYITMRDKNYAFGLDLTDSKRLEEERQRVDKLESIGVLAGGIAHDFNNILTSILGNISLAGMEAEPGSELQNSLEQAEKASQRAKDLTVQLLTFAKGGAPVMKLTSLTELLKDTAKFALHGSSVKCHFSIPADLWHAEIDAGQVSQVIHNLVINAQQATPSGGTIELFAENITLNETRSLGRGLPVIAGNYVRVAVADHGTGIPRENLEKIFDPFFTTKQKGNGLGLATSFSIARQHGGHISVESEPGAGSTFYLYLPASMETAAPKQAKAVARKTDGKARILVMDDEKGVREIAGRMLKHIGYEDVEFAADGAQALKIYKEAMESGKPFAVAILDLTIAGGMGGEVAIQKLLKIDPGVKAIVSSGYIDDSVIAKFRDYGFSGMVAKPYTLAELGKAVQDVIG